MDNKIVDNQEVEAVDSAYHSKSKSKRKTAMHKEMGKKKPMHKRKMTKKEMMEEEEKKKKKKMPVIIEGHGSHNQKAHGNRKGKGGAKTGRAGSKSVKPIRTPRGTKRKLVAEPLTKKQAASKKDRAERTAKSKKAGPGKKAGASTTKNKRALYPSERRLKKRRAVRKARAKKANR